MQRLFRFHLMRLLLGTVGIVSSFGCKTVTFVNPLPYSPNQAVDPRLVGSWGEASGGGAVSIFNRKDHLVVTAVLSTDVSLEAEAYTSFIGKRKFLNVYNVRNYDHSEAKSAPNSFIFEYEVNGNVLRLDDLGSSDLQSVSKPNNWIVRNRIVWNSTENLVSLLKTLPPLAKRKFETLKRLKPREYESRLKSAVLFEEFNRISSVLGIDLWVEDHNSEPSKISNIIVSSDSLAAKAGLESGDKIIKIDNQSFSSERELILELYSKGPKSKFSLTISRAGEEKTIQIEIPDKPTP